MSLITSDIVPSEDLIQLLDNNFRVEPNGDGGRDGPLRIVLSKIDRDFGQGRNNGRVGSGNSVGLLGGMSYLCPRPIEWKLDHTQT